MHFFSSNIVLSSSFLNFNKNNIRIKYVSILLLKFFFYIVFRFDWGYSGFMPWIDDIADASYVSPSGTEYFFSFQEVSKETDLKTASFTMPEKDGALIQSLGFGGRRFPLSCYFTGESCFEDADSFERALTERGRGELRHPVYGSFPVVPTGTIKRSDDLVKGLNVSVVEITFSETIVDEDVPVSRVVTEDAIDRGMADFDEAAAFEFASDMDPASVSEGIKAQNTMVEQSRGLRDSLTPLAKADSGVWGDFQSQYKSLEKSLDNFMADKISIAYKTLRLARLPSRVAVSALAKVEAYASMVNDLIRVYKKDPVGAKSIKHQYAATRLQLQAAVANLSSGLALSISGSQVICSSREAALQLAEALLDLFDKVVSFCDSKASRDIFVDRVKQTAG